MTSLSQLCKPDDADFYIPIDVQTSAKMTSLSICISNFLDASSNILFVQGSHGSGKTFSLLMYAKNAWDLYDNESFVPIFFDSSQEITPLQISLLNLNEKTISQKEWVFIFDDVEKQMGRFRAYFEKFKKAKFILASRYDPKGIDSPFSFCKLLPFDEEKIDAFFYQFCEVTLRKKIPNCYSTHEFKTTMGLMASQSGNPLFLSLFAKIIPIVRREHFKQCNDSSIDIVEETLNYIHSQRENLLRGEAHSVTARESVMNHPKVKEYLSKLTP